MGKMKIKKYKDLKRKFKKRKKIKKNLFFFLKKRRKIFSILRSEKGRFFILKKKINVNKRKRNSLRKWFKREKKNIQKIFRRSNLKGKKRVLKILRSHLKKRRKKKIKKVSRNIKKFFEKKKEKTVKFFKKLKKRFLKKSKKLPLLKKEEEERRKTLKKFADDTFQKKYLSSNIFINKIVKKKLRVLFLNNFKLFKGKKIYGKNKKKIYFLTLNKIKNKIKRFKVKKKKNIFFSFLNRIYNNLFFNRSHLFLTDNKKEFLLFYLLFYFKKYNFNSLLLKHYIVIYKNFLSIKDILKLYHGFFFQKLKRKGKKGGNLIRARIGF